MTPNFTVTEGSTEPVKFNVCTYMFCETSLYEFGSMVHTNFNGSIDEHNTVKVCQQFHESCWDNLGDKLPTKFRITPAKWMFWTILQS